MFANIPNDPTSKQLIDAMVPSLSSAVQQLRAHGIIHFDSKPENILQCDRIRKVSSFVAVFGKWPILMLRIFFGGS